MPFVPHSLEDERVMLETIGVSSIEELFDEIPDDMRAGRLQHVPEGISEMELLRLMNERARKDEMDLCFTGAGAYQHHIPSAVWDLVGRGEFLTAYTPYQAEASQGLLQTIYEYQTMMSRLTAMDVANASVYEGASAMAEAVLMAVRANRKSKSKRIVTAGNIHPHYLSVCRNIVSNQQIEVEKVAWDETTGLVPVDAMAPFEGEDIAAVIVSWPNFFGGLDHVADLTDWAHARGALVIGVVNPIALALLTPPGEWGETGADIVVGEGQPLGIPLASGGPYLGFMCCKKEIVRQMPGRIIGRTVDLDGKEGFALTLQAREQHIRRAKATSNICTNQGLLVTAATIYMSLMGDDGMRAVATQCHNGMMKLLSRLEDVDGVEPRFNGPVFHEAAIRLPVPAVDVIGRMAEEGILAGFDMAQVDETLADCLLTNVTETKTDEDIDRFVASLTRAVKR